MTYLPCDDQFRSASASSTHVTWRCIRNYTRQTLFTPPYKKHSRLQKVVKKEMVGWSLTACFCKPQLEVLIFSIWSGGMIQGENSELHSLYLRPLSWSWLTQGWVLLPQHCFWPKPGTHTPPRHWGPPQWLSACSHRLSQGLEKTGNVQHLHKLLKKSNRRKNKGAKSIYKTTKPLNKEKIIQHICLKQMLSITDECRGSYGCESRLSNR